MDSRPTGRVIAAGMIGNVLEWCQDSADAGKWRVAKGGNWVTNWHQARIAWRALYPPEHTDGALGFRCAHDLEAGAPQIEEVPATWLVLCDACGTVFSSCREQALAEATLSMRRDQPCSCGGREFVVARA